MHNPHTSSPSDHLPLQAYCRQLIDLFQQAIVRADPAHWLYRKDARSTLFMAESLARVLAGTLHSKKMEKACQLFKKLEDLLGEIDDYDHLSKHFSGYKAITEKEVNYFVKKRDKALHKLNKKLIKKEFYQAAFHDVAKECIVNFNDQTLVKKLQEHLREEMDKCWRFYTIFSSGFTDMEDQVHEIRRKLRWFSIYGQSFSGTIVLEKKKSYSWEKKFIAKKDPSDPFNRLPQRKDMEAYIHFDQQAFYVLNSVIAKLGDIKNKGLQVELLAKAIRKTREASKEEAEALALKQLRARFKESDLLEEAHALSKSYFETFAIHALLIS